MWSEMTPNALVNGTGVMIFSLCTDCISTISIRDGKYSSNFCSKCDKRTFAMKYPGHVEKFAVKFYELDKDMDVKSPEKGRTWKELVPCSVTGRGSVVSVVLASCCKPSVEVVDDNLKFNFCLDCQKRTGWSKYPKQFKNSTTVTSN